ncbi:28 kDa heat- and acid-stable phosphoprotein-like [Drosophila takahashii]|uniref:28 kDa heat- and acid-stable phosphoprotein-like n=1 Tax=Drosophila takahashii TaxID=29030 RepID=UPI001CF8DA46|nr:28 kDa heat- and acid-stable phosphoprotein-like [Drosophila takahashii]XP_016995451.2 28 kDa heat- and acid-stable phosphoprotein-like [Drosophila takahashii]XP_016995452.2 28 kDa heat- and acid-stable phosphoprotein-like [Drosophila takahashii]
MPRGKYVNHKGRCRQFTPSDILQMELEWIRQDDDDDYEVEVKSQLSFDLQEEEEDAEEEEEPSVGVHNLIEISNPNRLPRQKPMNLLITMTASRDQPSKDQTQRRLRERKQSDHRLRSKETVADLARLALVRKEREAAAQRRLAAKKAAAEAIAASNSDSSMKRSSPKSSEDSAEVLVVPSKPYQRKIRSSRKK